MGKSKKSGKTLAHTKEQTPQLPLSGNLQENLESSPCPAFSGTTMRSHHTSVRGTSILFHWCCPHRAQYLHFIYASYHFLFCCKRCIDSNCNEQIIDSDDFKSIWSHLHSLSSVTSKLLSFLVLRSQVNFLNFVRRLIVVVCCAGSYLLRRPCRQLQVTTDIGS
jgi:hypothetical protein